MMTKQTTKSAKNKIDRDKNKKFLTQNKIIITAALPYANGSIHIGHLLEYIQADIYARFMKLTGNDVLYICASDMHGTPIEINAKKAGIPPEKFVEKYWQEHQEDFASFLIGFDNYYKTHSPENKELAEWFFTTLNEKGFIFTKEIEQMYDAQAKQFLPDRFVKGTCPKCHAADQYSDGCENCGATYNPTDLGAPYSTLTNTKPILKKSTHYFFKLSSFAKELKQWISRSDIQPEIKHFIQQWLKEGLQDWCISRDAPYFGFEIPNAKKETGDRKYFYVWLDAPIGYISSTRNYCESADRQKEKQQKEKNSQKEKSQKKCDWKDYWYKGKVYHFIGKDIVYFHYLFWPAMLMAVGIPVPSLTTHGFITVDGKKMSKSRGTFFTAKDFLKLYDAEPLRFYYASHLDRKLVDVDVNFADFKAVTNNVLMGNVGNFCYRTLVFAGKNYGTIESIAAEKTVTTTITSLLAKVKENYLQQDFQSAVKNILKVADMGNAYFQKAEPWNTKESIKTQQAVGLCVNIARNIAIAIQPILPEFSRKIFEALGSEAEHGTLAWEQIGFTWKGNVNSIEKLVTKIEESSPGMVAGPGTVAGNGNEKKEKSTAGEKTAKTTTAKTKGAAIGKEVFPLHMRVGKIIKVQDHPNADSLYILTVNLGSKIGNRQVVAGIKKYFSKKELEGRKTVFCVNLKPAKLRGEVSEAMALMAEDEQHHLAFLDAGKADIGDEVQFAGLSSGSKEVTFEEFKTLKMIVSQGKVVFEGKPLRTASGDITVKGVQEGARIC